MFAQLLVCMDRILFKGTYGFPVHWSLFSYDRALCHLLVYW